MSHNNESMFLVKMVLARLITKQEAVVGPQQAIDDRSTEQRAVMTRVAFEEPYEKRRTFRSPLVYAKP